MFSHIMVGSNNIQQSKRFYDALFDAIGAKPGMQDEKGVNYRHNGAMLMVRPPLNGEAASYGNGSTIGFNLDLPDQVSAWHGAGVAAGHLDREPTRHSRGQLRQALPRLSTRP